MPIRLKLAPVSTSLCSFFFLFLNLVSLPSQLHTFAPKETVKISAFQYLIRKLIKQGFKIYIYNLSREKSKFNYNNLFIALNQPRSE